jgi:hypothetical protein
MLKEVIVTIGTIAGFAGAAGADPKPSPTPDVDRNLAALRALHVFEVGQLLVEMPEGAYNCYGPCQGKIDAAKQKAAERLAAFTRRAVVAAEHPSADACAPSEIERNLATLRTLAVVEVGPLVKGEGCERAGKLASIAKAVR